MNKSGLSLLLCAVAIFAFMGCGSKGLSPGQGYINVPGGKVWYRIVGSGTRTPLLLLHGGPGTPSYYLKPLAALADERPVIFYDQLGAGRSDQPTDTTLWRMGRFVDELARVREALGLKQVHILGHSWGTMLAADYMRTRPSGVRSLILASPALSIPRWLRDTDSLRSSLPDSIKAIFVRHEQAGTTDSPEYQSAVMVFYKNFLSRLDPWNADIDSTFAQLGLSVYLTMWGPNEFTATGNLKHYDCTDSLREIKVPTLFTAGRYDEATPATTKYYQSLVPGAKFALFENSAHLTMQDEAGPYAKVVREFLHEVEGGNLTTIPLAPLLAALGVMLTLAVMVERFLTTVNWLIARLFIVKSSTQWEVPAQQQEALALAQSAKAEEDLLNQPPGNSTSASPDPREIEPKAPTAGPDSRFDIKPATLPDQTKVVKEFWSQIFGCLVAIAGCFYSKFALWDFIKQDPAAAPHWVDAVLTGIIIGAGSKPVHFLIDFLVSRKIVTTREAAKEAAAPPEAEAAASPPMAPAIPAPQSNNGQRAAASLEEIVGFVYDGGDRPQRLEHTHLRVTPVDLIVYHHTAMHSDAPFEEVIKELDRKGWLTGYHGVVLKDGAIRTLCRWDRIGNHAYGFNNRSLGLALHGNFEPNPKVPGANANGAFGISQPTPAQLEAAARIVALWVHLYGVELRFPPKDDPNFAKGIVPHKQLIDKPCPGNNFPHEVFRQLVTEYAERWKNDAAFKAALEKFKSAPMVMA